MCLNLFFQRMIIEMLFNNKVKILLWNEFILKYIYNCEYYWKNFMNNFLVFSFGQIIHKIWMIKFEVLHNPQMKDDVNRINIRLFTEQVG
jgi:hypothetical protein